MNLFVIFNIFWFFVVRRAKRLKFSIVVFESKRKFLVGCYRLTVQHPAIVFVTERELQKCLYSNSRKMTDDIYFG